MATATAKKLKIRPLDDRVLIERNEAEEMTSGGIVLPDNAREKPQQGKVLATGPGKLLEKTGERGQMSVSVGDSWCSNRCAAAIADKCRPSDPADSSTRPLPVARSAR